MTAAERSDGESRSDRDDGRERGGLERVRTDPRTHAIAVGVAIVVGLVLAWLHWFGLVLAGALVGLVSPTLPRAILGALGIGLVVLAAFAIGLGESVWRVAEMTPVVYLTVASALGLPAFGALVRGLF